MKPNTDSGFLFSYIRFINLSPQGGSLDFYVGNTLVGAGIKFGSYTNYIKTATGPQVYKVTRCGRKDEVVEKIVFSQNIGDVHSLCVAGMADEASFIPVAEPTSRQNTDYGHLRICNFAPGSTRFDVWADDEMILGDIEYKNVSRYMEICPKSYRLSLFENKKRVAELGSFEPKKSKYTTLYIAGLKNEMPHLLGVFTLDAASFNGFYLL